MLLAKSLVILCSAAAVMAQSTINAVVSGAIFVGKDTTENDVSTYTIFAYKHNHATAVSSILIKAADMAGFAPASIPPKSLAPSLDTFVEKVSTFPGFFPGQTLDQSIALNGSFTQFEQVIRDADSQVSHLALIARSFRDLIPGYNADKSLTNWLLHLVVIDKPADDASDTVSFKLARVTLTIGSDKTHTTFIPKQNARLVVSTINVNGNTLVSNAERLSQLITEITRVPEAIHLLSSPKVVESDQFTRRFGHCNEHAPGPSFQQDVFDW